jgi:hypothetical protein
MSFERLEEAQFEIEIFRIIPEVPLCGAMRAIEALVGCDRGSVELVGICSDCLC